MNKINISIIAIFGLALSLAAFAEGDHSNHDHGKESAHKEQGHDENIDESGHGHDNHKTKDDHPHGKKHKKEDGHEHEKSGHKEKDEHSHQEEGHKEDGEHGHGDSHGGGGKAIGKGKAIVDVDEKKGIKLSKEAIKTLSIKLQTVEGSKFKISKKTLVTSKSKKGVYRFRNGYFKFMAAKILKEDNGGYQVLAKGVDFGDQIVVNGVGLLRVTDVYSTDKSEYGHSH